MEEWKTAEFKLSYNRKDNPKEKITGSEQAYKVFRAMWDMELLDIQEQFCVLYLNRANRAIGFRRICIGTLSGTIVDIQLIISLALLCRASGIILAHNHPSANMTPSEADRAVTNKVIAAAKLFDLAVLDHLIIGPEGDGARFFSFADEGLIHG
jgi:DNA repair protein RadC